MIFGLIPNLHKPELAECLRDVVAWAGANDARLLLPPAAVERFPELSDEPVLDIRPEDEIGTLAELLVAMGGDGTILAALRHAGSRGLPVLGINLGSLGFLADTSPSHVTEALDRVRDGEYRVEERMTIEAHIRVKGETKRMLAANDIVVDKGEYSRVIDIDAEVDGEFLKRFTGDGLIVATPTGSTAYALAAGGPIVEPGMQALVVAPICPHMLASRPAVIPGHSEVSLQVRSKHGTAQITGDGQERIVIASGDTLVIRRGEHVNKLVRTGLGLPFYEVLRTKLKWGFREPSERS